MEINKKRKIRQNITYTLSYNKDVLIRKYFFRVVIKRIEKTIFNQLGEIKVRKMLVN